MAKRKRAVRLTFGLGVAAAVVLVAVGYIIVPEDLDIGAEVVKAGIELGAVTLVGSAIAYHLHSAEQIRQDEHRKAEHRARLFHDLVGAYNGVKSARRVLRADGFRDTAPDRVMTAEDVDAFGARMLALTNCQLLFEGVAREVRARQGWFEEPVELANQINRVADHVKEVVGDWEDTDGAVTTGAHLWRIHELPHLQPFLGDSDEWFAEKAQQPMREIEKLLREAAYPSE